MPILCKHCATVCGEHPIGGAFCCAGCEQVYQLIQEEGLDGFYTEQDREGLPINSRSLGRLNEAYLEEQQRLSESSGSPAKIRIGVEGMSCAGCIWLIQHVAKRQSGLIRIEINLSGHWLVLEWEPRQFDLVEFGRELLRFGYRLNEPMPDRQRLRLSPNEGRCLLTGVFTVNAGLLALLDVFVLQEGQVLFVLLSIACLFFCLLVGGGAFFLPVYHAYKIKRWHSDCLGLLGVGVTVAFASYLAATALYPFSVLAAAVCSFIFILIVSRCLASRLATLFN